MNNQFVRICRILLFSLLIVLAMLTIPSGEQSNLSTIGPVAAERNYISDFQRKSVDICDNIQQEIFHLPKVYTLPMDQSVGPEPDPAGFSDDSYEDPTIKVNCWHERMQVTGGTVTVNFADVVIAHPTQLRSAFAGGKYGTKRLFGSKIAKMNHAVVAINADFYNYRPEGIIIRNATVFREIPYGTDILFIDADGNFSVMTDREAAQQEYYKKHKIYQTFSFGPALVINGKKLEELNIKDPINPRGNEPRTAIGQLGPLHYLLCTVDGRSHRSDGINLADLSEIMEKKKCIIAYNMDGGQSSILYFHDKPFNTIADGGERAISDILYFATAIPDSHEQTG